MRVGLVTPRPAELAYSRPPEKGPRSCDEVRGALLRGSSAVISNSDLLRWSCNASDKLSKPVRGDSVLRRGGGLAGRRRIGVCSERGLECGEQLNGSARYMQQQANNKGTTSVYLAFCKIVCMAAIYIASLTPRRCRWEDLEVTGPTAWWVRETLQNTYSTDYLRKSSLLVSFVHRPLKMMWTAKHWLGSPSVWMVRSGR
jgi:hypothetical protein